MRVLLCFAFAAAILPAGAEAQTRLHSHRVHAQRLPPVSGIIRVAPDAFGYGARSVVVHRASRARPAPLPQVITGGLWPMQRTYGYQRSYAAPDPVPVRRWATGGTGLAGLIGNTANPFAGQATWGTADSATTGTGTFGGRPWAAERERLLVRRYGEPAIYPTAYDVPSYGAAPQLGFYGSGTPYNLSYYSSGSSAGPYGSPGGLATYRSGSYGYGPRVITLPGTGRPGQGCDCGPRIVRLHRRHRAPVLD